MLNIFCNIKATFWYTYSNIACAMFATSGIGYMLSTAFTVVIASMCLGSYISLCTLKDISVIGPLLSCVSYARLFMEAQFEMEAQQYYNILILYGRMVNQIGMD